MGPGQLVYIGPANLCAHAWSSCLHNPGLLVCIGLFFLDMEAPRNTVCIDFVIHEVPRARDYHHEVRLEKLVMTHFSFSQIHDATTQHGTLKLLEPWK